MHHKSTHTHSYYRLWYAKWMWKEQLKRVRGNILLNTPPLPAVSQCMQKRVAPLSLRSIVRCTYYVTTISSSPQFFTTHQSHRTYHFIHCTIIYCIRILSLLKLFSFQIRLLIMFYLKIPTFITHSALLKFQQKYRSSESNAGTKVNLSLV